ncbi:VWA domain-containing protein [Nocardioides sp. CFH 31398]|uniref:VWA domain-containing protein n=1 Tax=Nocardioides sp. CFH 31398 TaxID=2919579 RepID=UPI001F060698|nr:VWA domain-containing protein [Nocardioides sp. CFH 31398]MCH1868815.1 VWA domain-containing protein [Nocardioides sp. CFH 31398]
MMLDRHLGFVGALRAGGVPVAVSEDLDALAAVSSLGWERRASVREAYAATLLKRTSHRPAFDALFDLWFPPRVGTSRLGEAGPDADSAQTEGQGAPDSGEQREDLRRRLEEALADPATTDAQVEALAVEAVGRFGRLSGRPAGASTWSAYTTLRRLAPGELDVDEDALAGFEAAVQREALRRIAEQKGAEHVGRTAVRPATDRVAFTSASAAELTQMRRAVAPLARRLAARLARDHRSGRRGPLDVRRTVRSSLGTGGVPLTTHHRPRRPRRTDLVVLCDVSGSVAHFARFTLMLVVALREQFSGVRAFAFVDDVVEVTDLLRPGADVAEVLGDLVDARGRAVRLGRTDYGRSLRSFVERHGDAVGPRTTVLVLGDARSNYSDPGLVPLKRMVDGARQVFWLNPEPRRQWDSGDSDAGRYAAVVPMAECRDLDQLARFVREHL